jgi:LmbE family N-acetylglucosaminyl deacetylase
MSSPFKECVRTAGCHVAAALLRQRSRPYVLRPGGALVIAPHPDDETLGCGGLLAAKAQAGHEVRVVFVTDGSGSHPRHPLLQPEELARLRRAEALAALGELGVPAAHAHFLEAGDGSLGRLDPGAAAELTRRIGDLIRAFGPAEVLTTWEKDGSTEHAAAARLTREALAAAGGGRLLEYPIWAWWNPLRLRRRLVRGADNLFLPLGPLLPVKRRALARHRSQAEPTPPWTEAVLPGAISRACCGPAEFYFPSHVHA